MRWLLIVLLVSLVAMLVALAGVTIHIWVRNSRSRSRASALPGPADDADTEIEN
jgi:uncharacterized membrane protein